MSDATHFHRCQLCKECLATVRATVPMAGERPRYWLCDECLADIEEHAEEVDVLR